MRLPTVSVISDKQLGVAVNTLYKATLLFYIALFGVLGAKTVSAAEQDTMQLANLATIGYQQSPSVNHLDVSIAQVELNSLLDRLVSNYERGELGAFVALFDESVITEDSSDRQALSRQYDELFTKTGSRLFMMHGIEWRKFSTSAVGIGEFNVKIKSNKGRYQRSYGGKLRVEVKKIDGKIVITKFLVQPS